MQLLLRRRPTVDGAILGDLFLDGVRFCFTLEREAVAIPPGTYPVLFTVSARAAQGSLWTPDPDHRLPLIDQIPGRTGVRLHALNEARQSDGCPGVGYEAHDATRPQTGPTITAARLALADLLDHLKPAWKWNQAVTITVEAAGTEHPVAV